MRQKKQEFRCSIIDLSESEKERLSNLIKEEKKPSKALKKLLIIAEVLNANRVKQREKLHK